MEEIVNGKVDIINRKWYNEYVTYSEEGEIFMEKIEFLTEEEKNALSFNDLATYMDLLNMLKTQIENIEG